MSNRDVPLERNFSPVPASIENAEEAEQLHAWGYGKQADWPEIDQRYRTIILAEGGAGKTFEMDARAKYLSSQACNSFFIRIEDIKDDFENAFEVGDNASFEQWSNSSQEAWFFLDSVDEARLNHPRAFEKALSCFEARIRDAKDRAHICISSRPYAWQPRKDFGLVDQLFPSRAQKSEAPGEGESENIENEVDEDSQEETGLKVYNLNPLDLDDIRMYAAHRSAPRIDEFITAIDRADLMDMAGRPFDLEGLIGKWNKQGALGGRHELLLYNIETRLGEIRPERADQQPLDPEHAREGARLIAAAVLLTGEPGIYVPDEGHEKDGIEGAVLLSGWGTSKDVRALLDRPLFNDVLYGMVRFRHRDVRELLAAEWFDGLLKKGHRRAVEALIFREQYGEKIVTPRMRPILPWLILFDDEIRRKALAIEPEIALEGGDIARLSLPERRKLLHDVVQRIVNNESDRSVRDNSAIARIAQSDLSEETSNLIQTYADHDDAIFFLGRLVWQGNMAACVPALHQIACDHERGKYARIAATRAVMTCGTAEQKRQLWLQLHDSMQPLPRELLAELIENSPANQDTIELLLSSIDKTTPYERFESSGVPQATHELIDRLKVNKDGKVGQPLLDLITGLNAYLDREPYMERGECHVSEEHTWLLAHASHAVERLVSARVNEAISDDALSVMLKVPSVRFWRSGDYDEYKSKLHALVPAWPELNDRLFWASVHQARSVRYAKKDERLIDDWPVQWMGHYWKFDTSGFERAVGFVKEMEDGDDRQVALSLAFRIYSEADCPEALLQALHAVVAGDGALSERLDQLLNPEESEQSRKWREDELSRKRESAKQKRQHEKDRQKWIKKLKDNPDLVRHPPGLKADEFSNDQYWLMREIEQDRMRSSRSGAAANWRALIPDFGEEVAQAFRDAATTFWSKYKPGLRSEGADTGSIPYALIFAMTGLEIEARENPEFPEGLKSAEVDRALRYITWELNGFPVWMEDLYKAFPIQTLAAIYKELDWELENSSRDTSHHYILHDLVYYAPWLHEELAPALLDRFASKGIPNDDVLRHGLNIMGGGKTDSARLTQIAQREIASNPPVSQLAIWYALWVDSEPETGIPAITQWLAGLGKKQAVNAAQFFITKLIGQRGMRREIELRSGGFKQAQHLKALYVLMHQYIRASEDNDRANGGVYSPELRDDAQDARNRLFNMLVELPGKESYIAISELITEHPDASFRDWMAHQASQRAINDGDLEPWTTEQVREFGRSLTRVPTSNRQLYEQGVLQLLELKHWLEQGNESPYAAWQAVKGETKIRNLVAGELNRRGKKLFRCAQENEFPNRQRPDIWLLNNDVPAPVPIELKVLDEAWSGPELCERLRNQLVGDYLREDGAECGIMLLVWQGRVGGKRWRIDAKLVSLDELADALKRYWSTIANNYPGVSAIEVVVIDLTRRAPKADD